MDVVKKLDPTNSGFLQPPATAALVFVAVLVWPGEVMAGHGEEKARWGSPVGVRKAMAAMGGTITFSALHQLVQDSGIDPRHSFLTELIRDMRYEYGPNSNYVENPMPVETAAGDCGIFGKVDSAGLAKAHEYLDIIMNAGGDNGHDEMAVAMEADLAQVSLWAWLKENSLEEFYEALKEGGVTKEDLPFLQMEDLEAMGIKTFKARRLMKKASVLA